MDANEKAFMEKLEKAKFESEVLRKAKRFKHILLHSETTHEKIGEVLGTNDRELIRRVLNEVRVVLIVLLLGKNVFGYLFFAIHFILP